MKTWCFLLGLASVVLISDARKTVQCLVGCKTPKRCYLPKCQDGMVLREDPCGCECPKCVCRKICDYSLKNICQSCVGGSIIKDPCRCKCPKCVCRYCN